MSITGNTLNIDKLLLTEITDSSKRNTLVKKQIAYDSDGLYIGKGSGIAPFIFLNATGVDNRIGAVYTSLNYNLSTSTFSSLKTFSVNSQSDTPSYIHSLRCNAIEPFEYGAFSGAYVGTQTHHFYSGFFDNLGNSLNPISNIYTNHLRSGPDVTYIGEPEEYFSAAYIRSLGDSSNYINNAYITDAYITNLHYDIPTPAMPTTISVNLIKSYIQPTINPEIRMNSESGSWVGTYAHPFTNGWFANMNCTDVNCTTINGSPASASSDKALKKSIYNLNDSYENIFNALIPKRFKYKEDTQMGSVYKDQFLGFIAQDVKKALDDNNITSQTIVNGEEGNYALSYMQFIPLNTWQIQKLKKRVSDLEERLAKLENRD